MTTTTTVRLHAVLSTLASATALSFSLGISAKSASADEPGGGVLYVQSAAEAPWPDISQPGPDMGDFPNSSWTLPRGRSYFENAPLTFVGRGDSNPAAWAWPFLVRYGVTDDVEFRIFANGLTSVFGDESATGISPLAFDLKVHLWDGNDEWFIPASSLEVYIQSEFGSPAFRQGTQKSIALNFDLPITAQTNLEWTIGLAGVEAVIGGSSGNKLHANEFSFQWSVEHNLTNAFQVFVTGYYNGAVFLQQGAGSVVGAGASWNLSDRLNVFGLFGAGLDRNVAPLAGQLGFAIAL